MFICKDLFQIIYTTWK